MQGDPILLLITGRWGKTPDLFFTSLKLVELLKATGGDLLWVLTVQEAVQYPLEGLPVIAISDQYREGSILSKVSGYLRHQYQVASCVWKFQGDTVFLAFGADFFILPILLAKLKRKRVILRTDARPSVVAETYWNVHNPVTLWLYRGLEWVSYGLSDILVPESTSMVSLYHLETYRPHIRIGGLYVDTERFRSWNSLQDRKYPLGFIGRLSEEKGIMEFCAAISLMKQSELGDILIIGDGPLYPQVRNQVAQEGLTARVEVMGRIENAHLPPYLNDIQCVVVPSQKEGLPNIILESMACGCIVVATPVGGIPDLIQDGRTGFLLQGNSPESIVEGIDRARYSPARDAISVAARDLIEREYTYTAAVERYRKIFDNLLE